MTNQEQILCPWCGAEMHVEGKYNTRGASWIAFTLCLDCGATGPLARDVNKSEKAIKNARAAALRRYTQPIKPMTREEAANTEEAVWYEYNGSTRTEKIDCVALPEAKAYTEICTLRRDSAWLVTTENYGKTWRCWSRKPTDEERSAAEWEK